MDPSSGSGALPWAMLAVVSLAVLLGMSLWFTASAVSPELQLRWGLTAGQAGLLTTMVQLGFVAGTAIAAILNLADLVPARPYFATSALCAGLANALLVVAPYYPHALVLRFLTGFFLAGVYPPAMKMISTWFRSGRGLAIGTVVGALTLGKALPYLLRSMEDSAIAPIVLSASLGALGAAVIIGGLYRDGPYAFPRRPFSARLVAVVLADRPTRLAIGGYLGHMWELYAGWTLVSVFFYDFFRMRGHLELAAASLAGLTAFAVIGTGALGAVSAGAWADRLGRERVTIWAMGVSATCSLVIGWLIGAPTWFVVAVALVWGFTVVADSAQFSALVTEVAPPHAVGTALTLQTSAGFLLTAGSIWLAIEFSGRFGWGPAFSLLAIGPLLGIVAMFRLRTARSQPALSPRSA